MTISTRLWLFGMGILGLWGLILVAGPHPVGMPWMFHWLLATVIGASSAAPRTMISWK